MKKRTRVYVAAKTKRNSSAGNNNNKKMQTVPGKIAA